MTEDEIKILKALANARIETAVLDLKDTNPRYSEVCHEQELSWQTADEILNRLSKDDRRTVIRHYEGEVHRFGFEIDAAYLQGMRDCIKALIFFGTFNSSNGYTK